MSKTHSNPNVIL